MEGVGWTYEIYEDTDGSFKVAYTSGYGGYIESNIPFQTEQEAEQAADEYVRNLQELDSEEWQ